jgi:UDP-N-acetylmuramate--alanine ligase
MVQVASEKVPILNTEYWLLNTALAEPTKEVLQAPLTLGCFHLAGIGGVGMSALAQALIDRGIPVSGSDRLLDSGDATDTLNRLRSQGVALYPQDGSGITAGAARLVVSSAIEDDNADLAAARRYGIPTVHRAAQLAELAAGRRLIAVTGTCGKSTVTAILGWLFQEAGLDPAVVNGAGVVGWGDGGRIASVRRGAGEWLVIEADESDRSLMVFTPEHAVITNASADHFGRDEALALFSRFRERVTGIVIDGVGETSAPAEARSEGWNGQFILDGILFTVPLPGMHNIWNAWHAVRLARALGIPSPVLAAGLATFRGVERRMQRTGFCGGAVVVDDYGHNPEKLAAAWTTLAAGFGRIIAVWRPHGYGPLGKMMEDLVAMFVRVVRPGDRLLILPVYDMGGTADRRITGETLVTRLTARGVPTQTVATLEDADAAMRAAAAPDTALVTFGARDPGLARLAARLATA